MDLKPAAALTGGHARGDEVHVDGAWGGDGRGGDGRGGEGRGNGREGANRRGVRKRGKRRSRVNGESVRQVSMARVHLAYYALNIPMFPFLAPRINTRATGRATHQ